MFISVNIGLSIPGVKARLLYVHETMKKFKNSPIVSVEITKVFLFKPFEFKSFS